MSKRRCGKTVFWVLALAIPAVLTVAVFAVDVGSTVLVRTRLQMAADTAALAAAAQIRETPERAIGSARHVADEAVSIGRPVLIDPADVELGLWEADVRLFTPTDRHPNAVRVTARSGPGAEDRSGLAGLFVGRMPFAGRASAVACVPPRDIAFVIDLSGPMNDATEPAWAAEAINNPVDGSTSAALSHYHEECPRHREEEVGGRQFDFPPRTQPLHAVRRSLIAAIQQLERDNAEVVDPARRDRVAVITFDGLCGRGPVIRQALTDDYEEATSACVDLQAAGDRGASAALEAGLETAARHLANENEGGHGRADAVQVVVLITLGRPDLFCSDAETIDIYRRDHPSPEFYRGEAYPRDAAIMQVAKMRAKEWVVFAVAAGAGADRGFLDRLARVAGTADCDGRSPRGADNPGHYDRQLVETLEEIIDRPIPRLVQ